MTTIPLPSNYAIGWVTGRFLIAQGDTVADGDRNPEARAATGWVEFRSLEWGRESAAADVQHEPIVCAIGSDGWLRDPAGATGVALFTGAWQAAIHTADQNPRVKLFTLTTAHTEAAPLNLNLVPSAAPVVPLAGPGAPWLAGPQGPAGDRLIPVTADVAPAAGALIGDLVGYWNTGTGTITVGPTTLEPGGHVVLAWGGTAWVEMDAGGGVPPEPPVWVSGTTATTGTPTATEVTVTFSEPIPAGTLQVRYGSADSWRTAGLTALDATTVELSGLTASTAYLAPDFRVINAAGESGVVTAQGFTTDAVPPSWQTVFYDTFTDVDGTDLTAHTPDYTGIGGWVGANAQQILNNQSAFLGTNPVHVSAPVANGKVRLTFSYEATGTFGQHYPGIEVAIRQGSGWHGAVANSRFDGQLPGLRGDAWTVTPIVAPSAPIPASGDAVLTLDGGTFTWTVNGALVGQWTVASGGSTPMQTPWLELRSSKDQGQVAFDDFRVELWR